MIELSKIIDRNLLIEALDETERKKTLLSDEKCKDCGAELMCSPSVVKHYKGHCGRCAAEIRRLKKIRCRTVFGRSCSLLNKDPDFNKGHGKRFFDAVDRSILRRDLR